MTVAVKPDSFAWSFSRLHSWQDCPRRYYEKDVLKAWPEVRSAQLELGDAIHIAMAARLKKGIPLPASMQLFEPWIDRLCDPDIPGELLVEDDARFAITRDYKPTPWFSDKVWLRAIADAVKLGPRTALAIDWKTGRSDYVDVLQLTLASLVLLAHFPKISYVRAEFIFLNKDEQIRKDLYRGDMADEWARILPQVKKFEQATLEGDFPPKPGRFCRSWCPVASCEHWGKRYG